MTLEEQMICGALQTLNEEALEDILQAEPAPLAGELRDRAPSPLTPHTPHTPNTPSTASHSDVSDDERSRDHVVVNFPEDSYL